MYQPVLKVTYNMEVKSNVYAQPKGYFHIRGDLKCNCQLFREDLVNIITSYMKYGERINIFTDEN